MRVEDVEVDAVDDSDTLLVRQSVGEEDRVVEGVLVPLPLRERVWEPLNVKVARALADLYPELVTLTERQRVGERVRLLEEVKDALTLPESLGLPLGEEEMEKEGVRDSAGDMDALPLIDMVAHWVAGEEEEGREGEVEGEAVRQVVPLELREEERVRELVTVPVLEREVDMEEEVQGVGE